MKAELGSTRDPSLLIPGDVGELHRAAAAWRARAESAQDVGSALHSMRTVPDWAGEAADAYETRAGTVASGWTAMATAFRSGQSALEDVAAAIDAARAKAGDAIDLWDQADALDAAAFEDAPAESTGWLGPDRRAFLGSAPRAEARAVLADARTALSIATQKAEAALRAAIAAPGLGADEWAAILTGCANSSQVLDALAGADAASLAALLRARPSLAGVLAQAEPAAVAPWWAQLDDSQRDALIHAAPAIIGNLGGVAYAARDEANRIWLEDQLADARAALAEAERPPTYDEILGGYAAAQAYAERLDQVRSRVKGLEDIESSLASPDGKAPRFLMSLTADSPPLAAVLTEQGVHVDTYVTLGSAGLPAGVEEASDLQADQVFAGQAQDVWKIDPAGGDAWAWTGRLSPDHPINPVDPGFGANTFSVAGDAGSKPVLDHNVSTPDGTGYLDFDTESLRNVALATTGQGALVSPYVPPGPTPFQQSLIEGMTHGPIY